MALEGAGAGLPGGFGTVAGPLVFLGHAGRHHLLVVLGQHLLHVGAGIYIYIFKHLNIVEIVISLGNLST